MALVVKDRVKQTTTTTGTGSIVLNGTVDGFQTFTSALATGDTTYYAIVESSTNEWEVGLGTWTESTTTLARTTILESSNSGSAINLTAGEADVFITQPAEKAAYLDASGDLVISNDISTTTITTNSGGGSTVLGSNLDLGDNQKIRLGASDDLEIYHSGSYSYIKDLGTGGLYIDSNGPEIQLRSNGGAESMAKLVQNAQVELYYDGSKKLETGSTGAIVTGLFQTDSLAVNRTSASYELDVEGQAWIRGNTQGVDDLMYLGEFSDSISPFATVKYDDSTGDKFKININRWGADYYFTRNSQSGSDINMMRVEGSGTTNLRLYDQASPSTSTTTTQPVHITTNGSSYFNGGNVGIGTSSPAQKLDVEGTAQADRFLADTGGGMLRRYQSTWTYPTHDVIHSGYLSAIGDYVYLKAAGNSADNHGQLIVADNGIFFGKTNAETGAATNSATSPFDNTTYGRIDSTGFTVSGDIQVNGENLYVGGFSGQAKIHLNATDAGSPQIELSDTDNDNFWTVAADDSDNNFKIQGSTSSIPNAKIDSPNFEIAQGGELRNNGNLIWTAGNDGSGSGLDADTVDGIQAASFLRSDANDTKTGNIVLQTSGAVTNTTTGLFFETGGSYDDGRYRTRFRKQDVGGGIPLYIDQSSSTANSYTAQARFGTYSGNNYEFEVFGDMKANGDVAATGAFNFSSNSGDVIEYGGSTFMKRLTTNGGTRIGKDDILILGAGETAGTIESNTNHAVEEVYIGGDSGIRFISSPDNWATSWAGRNEMVYNTSGDLSIPGALSATTKSFDIEHPTKEGMRLRYGSLEGPENGVYVRGRLKDNNTIELPDYWTGLVHEDTITVNLTAIGKAQDLWVEDIKDNKVIVGGDSINCFYTVYAERKDVERFDVEYENEN